MRHSIRLGVIICLLAVVLPTSLAQRVSLSDVAERAVAQSKLTLPGSAPFHLKAKIAEKDSPGTDLTADIDLIWVSPEKWRRSIKSPDFAQTLIVNGGKISEQNNGDYYPFWLRELVTALTDPLPMLDSLKRTNSMVAKPSGGENSNTCARFESRVGVPPAQNSAFYVFCFEGSHGLLEDVTSPQYSVEFKDYKTFKTKNVARLLVTYPEPGDVIEANITELSELTNVDESQFAVPEPTPKAMLLESVSLSEDELRKMALQTPEIIWPSIRIGKTSGVLSIYVSVDKSGHVRETFPLNSDNSDLNDAVRKQVLNWQFKPAASNGVPVQVESILTFAFNTKVENPVPILSDADARMLATNIVEPAFRAGTGTPGASFTVRILVDVDGKLLTVGNPNNVPDGLFLPAYGALVNWHFRPYLKDGKPDTFQADITFLVH